jgi:5-methylcytosine-specific restriction endonuclease McrA
MIQIVLHKRFEQIAKAYCEELMKSDIWNKIQQSLSDLIDDIESDEDGKPYIEYIDWIKNNLQDLIIMHPSEYPTIDEVLKDAYHCKMDWKDWKTEHKPDFGTRVSSAMHYSKVREKILPKYIDQLGIKTCVYCNIQYALTTKKRNGRGIAYYELDHAWPKSEYPYLALSFFNFHPCCGSCNRHKSTYSPKPPYTIYDAEVKPNVQFSIKNESLVNYILTNQSSKLDIDMQTDSSIAELYSRLGILKQHKLLQNEAEDIVWQTRIFNDNYCQQLAKAYKSSFLNSKVNLYRLLYGIYAGEKNVYVRPLTKFKQDIIKQLKNV